jgi:hypothetical protein
MEANTHNVESSKLKFNRGNPESPPALPPKSDEDSIENESTIFSEEEEERKQLAEELREREIEKTYDEEDESNQKDWPRF